MYKDIQLQFVSFGKEPHIDERSTSIHNTKEMNKDIAKFPFVVREELPFEIRFIFKKKYAVTLKDVIPAGFTYNMADIPFWLQPISYDKHSPYVRDAALIHDYLLKYKKELYKLWNLKAAYGMRHQDFRILTSDVFEYVLIQSGVPEKKARLMRNNVDIFQKLVCWSWMRIY